MTMGSGIAIVAVWVFAFGIVYLERSYTGYALLAAVLATGAITMGR